MAYNLQAAKRAIRAECTARGIDDDARRAMMQALAGVTSSTQLDADGARKVLNHLRKKSALAGRQGEWAWVETAPEEKRALLWKIRRCCIERGIAAGGQMAYAEGVAERVFGLPRNLRMMSGSELYTVAGALQRTVNRQK